MDVVHPQHHPPVSSSDRMTGIRGFSIDRASGVRLGLTLVNLPRFVHTKQPFMQPRPEAVPRAHSTAVQTAYVRGSTLGVASWLWDGTHSGHRGQAGRDRQPVPAAGLMACSGSMSSTEAARHASPADR